MGSYAVDKGYLQLSYWWKGTSAIQASIIGHQKKINVAVNLCVCTIVFFLVRLIKPILLANLHQVLVRSGHKKTSIRYEGPLKSSTNV